MLLEGIQLQSTPPHKGATRNLAEEELVLAASIPAPSQGGDPYPQKNIIIKKGFNPRPLTRGRRVRAFAEKFKEALQSTPPHKGATKRHHNFIIPYFASIHAPSQGGDGFWWNPSDLDIVLQSTPPHKGATFSAESILLILFCFNPRPLTRGRPFFRASAKSRSCFNPRPLTRGRQIGARLDIAGMVLQSTPPHKGATICQINGVFGNMLQSTPPHKGATRIRGISLLMESCFNPRPLTRGRQCVCSRFNAVFKLQSTPPHKGATGLAVARGNGVKVLQSTPPHKGATGNAEREKGKRGASIHAPSQGGDADTSSADQ